MKRIIFIVSLGLTAVIAARFSIAKNQDHVNALETIHKTIISDYPDMSHISRTELAQSLASEDVLILDTRPQEEYAVSHIKGARQVDPDISPQAFKTRFGHAVKNKKVIVYCSVGHRSSNFGQRLQSTALSAGAVSVQNMEGGLFGWHNDARPLENAAGTTTYIHPYNARWGRLVKRKDDIRYHP